MIKFIRGNISRYDLLCQLAEEASELAKAALKLIRAEGSTTPTPVTVEDAESDLLEEVADVMLVLDVLDIDVLDLEFDFAKEKKLKRWCQRLEDRNDNRRTSV